MPPAQTKPARKRFEVKLGAATREAFGRTLVELGRENKDVVVVDADLSKSTMTTYFQKEFPDRFFSCGIAEANMVGVGAGLAMAGKIPFVASFSVFVMNKGFEQMRIGALVGAEPRRRSNLRYFLTVCALPAIWLIGKVALSRKREKPEKEEKPELKHGQHDN